MTKEVWRGGGLYGGAEISEIGYNTRARVQGGHFLLICLGSRALWVEIRLAWCQIRTKINAENGI